MTDATPADTAPHDRAPTPLEVPVPDTRTEPPAATPAPPRLTDDRAPTRRRGRLVRGLTTAALVLAIGSALYAVSVGPADAETTVPTSADTPMRVQVAAVTPAASHVEHRYFGTTRPAASVSASFTQPGRIAERGVEVGDVVEAGQVLARLDRAPLDNRVWAAGAAVEEVRAQRDQLDRDIDRVERLIAAEIGTDQSLEQLEAQRERIDAAISAASVQYNEAARMRGEGVLEAPIAGVVTEVYAESGEFVQPGQPIVRISGADGVEVEIDVPEATVHRIASGDRVRIELPMSDRPAMDGTVERISRAAAERGRLYPVVVSTAGGAAVPPGAAAEVLVDVPLPDGLAVPLRAVVDPTGQFPGVYVVRDDHAVRVPIEVVAVHGGAATVRGELAVGDLVVRSGLTTVADGRVVEVAR